MQEIEKNFDLSELVALTAEDANMNENDVKLALVVALNILKTKIAQTGYAELNHFGSFQLKTIKAESGKTPGGIEYSVGERQTVEFNPFKAFREELEAKTGIPAIL